MKIVQFISSLNENAGGPSRSVPQTCEYLSRLGVTVQLITQKTSYVIKLNTNHYFTVNFRSLLGLIFYAFRLKKDTISLIHLQHLWSPYIHIMALTARLKGIPYIITPRGMLEPWIMNQNKLKKRIWMRLFQLKDLQHASFIHATCEMEKQNIQQLGIKTPIKVIPNGIDISKIPVCSKSYGSRKIVFLSRIHPKKGLELLIEAWSKINTEEWKLVIAGDGDKVYIQQLKALLTQLKINNIEFVGSVYGEDKWKFLLSADLFVLPTYSENFGIAIAEALVMGVPVITTKGTPWSELETYSCGWWIELNVDNLAYTLKSAMLKTPYELQEMGDNGIRLIKNNYDIVNVSLKIKEMYNESVL